jgi:hypothetical protein
MKRVEGLERADECAGWKYLDFDAPAGRSADRLGETNRAGLEPLAKNRGGKQQ